jgi:hypothetical protein
MLFRWKADNNKLYTLILEDEDIRIAALGRWVRFNLESVGQNCCTRSVGQIHPRVGGSDLASCPWLRYNLLSVGQNQPLVVGSDSTYCRWVRFNLSSVGQF